jgi:hypothetical protein
MLFKKYCSVTKRLRRKARHDWDYQIYVALVFREPASVTAG